MSLIGTAILSVQGLLGFAELAAGGSKIVGRDSQIEIFEHLGYPQWFRLVTGSLEVVAGLALLISFFVTPVMALAGGVISFSVLVGALTSHVRVGDEPSQMVPAVFLLVLATVVIWNHSGVVV